VCETAVTLEKCFLFATRSRTVALGYGRYARRTPATAKIFVFLNAGYIYVRVQGQGEVDALKDHWFALPTIIK